MDSESRRRRGRGACSTDDMLDLCRRSDIETCESVLLNEERLALDVRLSRDDVRRVMEIGRAGFGMTGDDRADGSSEGTLGNSSGASLYAPGTRRVYEAARRLLLCSSSHQNAPAESHAWVRTLCRIWPTARPSSWSRAYSSFSSALSIRGRGGVDMWARWST